MNIICIYLEVKEIIFASKPATFSISNHFGAAFCIARSGKTRSSRCKNDFALGSAAPLAAGLSTVYG